MYVIYDVFFYVSALHAWTPTYIHIRNTTCVICCCWLNDKLSPICDKFWWTPRSAQQNFLHTRPQKIYKAGDAIAILKNMFSFELSRPTLRVAGACNCKKMMRVSNKRKRVMIAFIALIGLTHQWCRWETRKAWTVYHPWRSMDTRNFYSACTCLRKSSSAIH